MSVLEDNERLLDHAMLKITSTYFMRVLISAIQTFCTKLQEYKIMKGKPSFYQSFI